MSNLEQYVATRVEMIKQRHEANLHALKRQAATLWGLLDPEQQKEAAERYFEESRPLLQAGK